MRNAKFRITAALRADKGGRYLGHKREQMDDL